MSSQKSVIIIPTYNEKDNVPQLTSQIFHFIPQTDILFIDDNSPDGTRQKIKELQKNNPHLYLLERPQKMGLGSAYITGFKWALEHHYDFIFEMDADLSHQPKYLPKFLEAAKTHDLVLGSRYIPGGGVENWNLFRRLLSRGGSLYSRFWLRLPYKDLTGGFKCFRSQVLKSLNLDSVRAEGYCFQVELTFRAHQKGFKIAEVPIIFPERTHGKSKISRKIVLEALWKVPLLYFRS
ncbi:MAG: dolichyl-phosphate beta-D-mannosyltransferase [Deltaproteobacteria bacterium GWA2_38_16]|nr:MAG: dolichyl-phosphate beta-D-mannosyltransferase [Deltaproteobacteria bacterium GWA2_38_16]OGQ01962.1 MAG: dolichyl-phosphate beta-D-mannosyltransferase [Deltaproteobacteria bacterium RIFCSPHIGHO2_02_FULL_38_15]OGQ33659.1 MAG: dolichyl-phosphate beta-D-mannosyltransferase [Deltaproteobacteria bacterium RIFCSPLOWO2_01_FULL_38_9]HBQ21495.1 dolichyl-phosphate beta-D-mannosyltransferase [Deltaproteobacteria bacterium]